MWFYLLTLTIGGTVVGGCDAGFDVENQVRDQLDEARQRWQEQSIRNYQFIYAQQRGDVIVDTAEVFVRSGTVDSIATSPEVSEDELLVGTVGSFFDLIEDRIGEDDSQFGADFDDEQGFPVSYNADFQDDRRSQDIITIALVDSVNESQETQGQ
jgi:hypothetical protein